MLIALIPLKTKPKQPGENLRRLEMVLASLTNAKPDLIVLPECTLTGYLYEENDLAQFATPIHGQTVAALSQLARQHRANICFGMIERHEAHIYDSGILLDREGQVVLVQRKMSEKPPFQNGEHIEMAETELGKVAMLICGDLFHAEATAQLPNDLDLVLAPMARAFAGQSPDKERWETEERAEYLQAVKAVGKLTFLVNALDEGIEEPSFGGALVVDSSGKILAESPHGSDQVLLYAL
jgi:predicted amidohydrolase